jgi:hypothetical protein
MNQEIRVLGTIQADGTLVLDEKLSLPPGRVQVNVQQLDQVQGDHRVDFLARMEKIWAGQEARGHISRSREEIDADINCLRNDAEEEMKAVERLHEQCQQALRQRPEQSP